MPAGEQNLAEQMALSAQLARQFCHDCRNFLYNLSLQIEIWETLPNPQPADWESVKREAKRLAGRMQEWESFQRPSMVEETSTVDLNQMLQRIQGAWLGREVSIELAPSVVTESMPFTGCAADANHLLCLLLEDAVPAWQGWRETPLTIAIQTERSPRKIIVRIAEVSSEPGRPRDGSDKKKPESLIESACQSLAQRLDATIHREIHADGSAAIIVEFPRSSSS